MIYAHAPYPLITDRKVQTIKDLEKPWTTLTPQLPAATSPKWKSPLQPAPQTWTGHSAATTILLDDSHAKAARQPYNHLCVPEYSRARRNADLAALQHAQEATTSSPSPPPQDGNNETRKRKRKREKEQQRQQLQPSPPAPLLPTANDPSARAGLPLPTTPALDETLLAVIGILHAARLQSSIAGWVRAGALLSERGAAWCDDPALVHTWAQRGREAARELQLEVEHGVIPDP